MGVDYQSEEFRIQKTVKEILRERSELKKVNAEMLAALKEVVTTIDSMVHETLCERIEKLITKVGGSYADKKDNITK